MSSRDYPLHTVENDCQDCYKCVRSCPVKAIKIEDSRAMIVPSLCIACGTCYTVCPAKAKQPRNDLIRAKNLINISNKEIYVSLAPSWITEFDTISKEQMIASLRRLGFKAVSETALGAEEVSSNIAKILSENKKGLYISSACPSVVEYINKYIPSKTSQITALSSPLLSHCQMLKDEFGTEIEIIFIGPCIAKKYEADRHADLLSLSLTFSDLRQWFKDEGITPEEIKTSVFDKFVLANAEEGTAYPIEGGMIETIKPYQGSKNSYLMQITGIDNIKRELKNINAEDFDKPIFIECLACEGGCVNGPCMSVKKSGLEKRLDILKETKFDGKAGKRTPKTNIKLNYNSLNLPTSEITDTEIKRQLARVGKYTSEDEINCNGCGYETCRNFAKALITGKAEPEMCVSHMKKLAQKKANALIRCIPSPIVITDISLKIMEYNQKFLETFWNDEIHAEKYDKDNLNGADLKDFVNFTNLFAASLEMEQDIHKEHVRHEDKLFDVVVFNIDKNQIVGGIITDVTNVEMKKDLIAKKAKEVIHKNLATVQQIACTLGEHMAETEVLLRSIARDFSNDEEDNTVSIRTKSNKRDS